MMAATRKIRPPAKRHGGKSYLARRIVALMPEHRVYVEPFVGGGSVLLTKPKVEREVAGDLDSGLIGMWRALSGRAGHLIAYLNDIPYSDASFGWATHRCEEAVLHDSIPDAAAYIVRNRFSRGGLGKTYAWSDRLRGGQPEQLNSWDTIRAELPAIADRVLDVEFYCCDARTLILSNDDADALIYCDPPYLHETRTAISAYEHEMDRAGHVALLDVLMGCRGAVMLSGYASDLYSEKLAGWDCVRWELPNNSGQGKTKQRRVECLWSNRPLEPAHV
jgi:DNA adenine methylase